MPPKTKAESFAAAAKEVSAELDILHAEADAVLKKLASDDDYAASLFEAVEGDNRREVITLLRKGGIRRARIGSFELFPGNLKIKVMIDMKRGTLYFEIET